MMAVKGLTSVVAGLGLVMVGVGCSSGAVERTTSAVAVKAELQDHGVSYRGDVRCVGNHLPIICTSSTINGSPITATFSRSSGRCQLVVVVGTRQISRTQVDCPDR
jgi:hypothetical protein